MSVRRTAHAAKQRRHAQRAPERAARKFQIKVIVINRSGDRHRLQFQQSQLQRLGFDFMRVDAFTPETLPNVRKSYWRKWRRPLRDTEKARLLSHGLAWDWVVDNGPALILEDDAVLASSLPEILTNLEVIDEVEYLSLEVRGRRKHMGKLAIPIGHGIACHRLFHDKVGSAAYVLWPSGAEKLIRRAARGAVNMDGLASWARNVKCYQADPACAVQLDMAEEYGLRIPRDQEEAPRNKTISPALTPHQFARLGLSQIFKYWRRARYFLTSDHRKVDLRPEYFDI